MEYEWDDGCGRTAAGRTRLTRIELRLPVLDCSARGAAKARGVGALGRGGERAMMAPGAAPASGEFVPGLCVARGREATVKNGGGTP